VVPLLLELEEPPPGQVEVLELALGERLALALLFSPPSSLQASFHQQQD
jgi:hypothetical protein